MDFEEDDLQDQFSVIGYAFESWVHGGIACKIWQCLDEKLKTWESSRDFYHTLDVTGISRDGREMPFTVLCG
jgi:hypothetical protein